MSFTIHTHCYPRFYRRGGDDQTTLLLRIFLTFSPSEHTLIDADHQRRRKRNVQNQNRTSSFQFSAARRSSSSKLRHKLKFATLGVVFSRSRYYYDHRGNRARRHVRNSFCGIAGEYCAQRGQFSWPRREARARTDAPNGFSAEIWSPFCVRAREWEREKERWCFDTVRWWRREIREKVAPLLYCYCYCPCLWWL